MKKYDAYKDSGVKWIGEVPEHWEITPLKFCFNVLSGCLLYTSSYRPISLFHLLTPVFVPYQTISNFSFHLMLCEKLIKNLDL